MTMFLHQSLGAIHGHHEASVLEICVAARSGDLCRLLRGALRPRHVLIESSKTLVTYIPRTMDFFNIYI